MTISEEHELTERLKNLYEMRKPLATATSNHPSSQLNTLISKIDTCIVSATELLMISEGL